MDLRRVAEFTPRPIGDQKHDAGVLIPVIERDGEYHLLFTKRADHLGKHPGQMSFPGGGNEPGDVDIRETALREAYEEIGLHPDEVDLVGRLDDIRTITEYAVTPFVGMAPDREYDPNEREVAEVAVLPVAALLDDENYEYEHRDHPHYGEIVIHYFHVDGYTVWGATGRILVQLLELTTDWRAPMRLDRRI
ncbi:NUDIX hydrolase [Haloarchaeobius amylolyticus]|uniref:NUDIX hydrolase n=1 Tax=Haloarchaeobius amylolyticus TaxID=1198296 RepID=UPI00226E0A4F|nr:CoA pyrophosphatase [Haloarchaeobius amylolyticus]